MRLDYKILWVEDVADWVDACAGELETHMFSRGFELKVSHLGQAPNDEEMQELVLDQYHLILMDYNREKTKLALK
ncbi:MAG: hypothetical protein LBJ64_03930 [Deltaproteobacteria bacterium]|jgi:hypothetical protein|nr:hypothetical protein [Deltaproteobacteria bacterium]